MGEKGECVLERCTEEMHEDAWRERERSEREALKSAQRREREKQKVSE